MQLRLSFAIAVLACGIATTARAGIRSTTIEYRSGSGGTGYDSASFRARYALHACDGSLVGGSLGSMRLPLAEADIAKGVHMRSGIVYRPISGLAFALSLGFDTTAASSTQFAEAFFADLGVLWRFDTNDNRKYMIQ